MPPDLEQQRALWLRAACVPLVLLSFVLVGIHQLRPVVNLTDSLLFALLALALCIAAGARYLLRAPGRGASRIVLVAVYVPLMAFALWAYAFLFGMLVLGIFP